MIWTGKLRVYNIKLTLLIAYCKSMCILLAPLMIESPLITSTIFKDLEDFNLNIKVSGSDIGEPHLIWNPVLGKDGTKSGNDVSEYVHERLIFGDFQYGQKKAVLYTISPEAFYPIFCNDSTYFNGNYTLLVQEGQSSKKRRKLLSFYVDINGKSKSNHSRAHFVNFLSSQLLVNEYM